MHAAVLPTSLAQILKLAKLANCVSWSRDLRRLDLTLDDHAKDRRRCIAVRLDHLTVELRTLSGFDSGANRWSSYCEPHQTGTLQSQRGISALRRWIAEQALAQTGFLNPPSFSVYARPEVVRGGASD